MNMNVLELVIPWKIAKNCIQWQWSPLCERSRPPRAGKMNKNLPQDLRMQEWCAEYQIVRNSNKLLIINYFVRITILALQQELWEESRIQPVVNTVKWWKKMPMHHTLYAIARFSHACTASLASHHTIRWDNHGQGNSIRSNNAQEQRSYPSTFYANWMGWRFFSRLCPIFFAAASSLVRVSSCLLLLHRSDTRWLA